MVCNGSRAFGLLHLHGKPSAIADIPGLAWLRMVAHRSVSCVDLHFDLLIHFSDELRKSEDATRIAEPEFSQTLSTVIQVALVDLFEWVGVVPAVVVGHSSGEIAAALVLSLIRLKRLTWCLDTALVCFPIAPLSEWHTIVAYLHQSWQALP